MIVALGGHDRILAKRGFDVVCAGPGNDRVLGGGGRDTVFGAAGDDAVFGAKGVDRIFGGAGRDLVSGGRGSDRIRGGAGADKLMGGIGPDRVWGGGGDDAIWGGPNRDRLWGGGDDDFIDGGSGGETIWGNSGDDLIRGRDAGDKLYGGRGADRLYGDLIDDKLWGGPDDDVLIGGHGIDHMYGQGGNDLMRGGTNGNWYVGGSGRDTASFATATPIGPAAGAYGAEVGLSAGTAVTGDGNHKVASVERVLGSAFNDYLRGMPGTSAHGGSGEDQCSGFSQMFGCGGELQSRYLYVDRRDPRDPGVALIGGSGSDRWTVSGEAGGVRIRGTHIGFDDPACSRIDGSTVHCDVEPRFVVAWGANGNDRIAIGGGLPYGVTVDLDGGYGKDALVGGPDDDVLIDRGGRSRLLGGRGSDALLSGPGRDVLNGGPASDQLVTSRVCDGHVFIGGKGSLDIAGFARVRVPIHAKRGGVARARRGGACNPTRVRFSSEVLEGTGKGDILIGTPRIDYIIGRRGNDVLIGRGGRDRLRGGPGRDRCVAGPRVGNLHSCERR